MRRREIETKFSTETPESEDEDQQRAHEIVGYKTKELAHILNAMTPKCPEKYEAIELLKQCLNKAHEAIAKSKHIGAPWRNA